MVVKFHGVSVSGRLTHYGSFVIFRSLNAANVMFVYILFDIGYITNVYCTNIYW